MSGGTKRSERDTNVLSIGLAVRHDGLMGPRDFGKAQSLRARVPSHGRKVFVKANHWQWPDLRLHLRGVQTMAEKLLIVCPHCQTRQNSVPRGPAARRPANCRTLATAPCFDGTPSTLDDAARFSKQVEVSDIPILSGLLSRLVRPLCHALTPHFPKRPTAGRSKPERASCQGRCR